MTLLAAAAPTASSTVLDVRHSTPDGMLDDVVRAAERDVRPLFVLVDAGLTREEHGTRRAYADHLAERGAVIRWEWSIQELPRLDRVLGRAVLTAPAVAVDVAVRSTVDALTVIETAWHAGCLTVLREIYSHGDEQAVSAASSASAAAALADVLVTAGAPAALRDRGPAAVVSRFEAADAVDLVGAVDPPQTELSLTVLLTTYERPDDLAACLQALTRQTLPCDNFDVVVVDDASAVDVTDIVERFTGQLRLTFVRMPVNSGVGAARGAGLQLCRGDIVLLLDDDDLPGPRVLAEHLRKHHEARGEDTAVLGHTVVRPDGHSDVLSRHVTREGRQYFSYGTMVDGQELPWHWFWGGRSSAKRSLLEQFPFRGAFMEDTDAAWRAHSALEQQGLGLRVVYARRSVQVAASSLALSGMRRRQVKMGRATGLFLPMTGDDLHGKLPGARAVVAARSRIPGRVLSDLVERSAELLTHMRSGPRRSTAAQQLGRLDSLLQTDLAAHHAIGLLAAATMARATSEGRCPVVGLDAEHPDLVAVVAATSPQDRVRLVVRLAPATSPEEAMTDLRASLAAAGRTVDSVGDVELRVSGSPVEAMPDIDFVLPQPGPTGRERSCALELFGLTSVEWVAWIASGGTAAGGLR